MDLLIVFNTYIPNSEVVRAQYARRKTVSYSYDVILVIDDDETQPIFFVPFKQSKSPCNKKSGQLARCQRRRG